MSAVGKSPSEHGVALIRECLSAMPIIVLGSGHSAAFGSPGMDELRDHLFGNVPPRVAPADVAVWTQFEDTVGHKPLEAALHDVHPSPELMSAVRVQTGFGARKARDSRQNESMGPTQCRKSVHEPRRAAYRISLEVVFTLEEPAIELDDVAASENDGASSALPGTQQPANHGALSNVDPSDHGPEVLLPHHRPRPTRNRVAACCLSLVRGRVSGSRFSRATSGRGVRSSRPSPDWPVPLVDTQHLTRVTSTRILFAPTGHPRFDALKRFRVHEIHPAHQSFNPRGMLLEIVPVSWVAASETV